MNLFPWWWSSGSMMPRPDALTYNDAPHNPSPRTWSAPREPTLTQFSDPRKISHLHERITYWPHIEKAKGETSSIHWSHWNPCCISQRGPVASDLFSRVLTNQKRIFFFSPSETQKVQQWQQFKNELFYHIIWSSWTWCLTSILQNIREFQKISYHCLVSARSPVEASHK